MITATIVDDEPDCCEALATLLQRYCPDVKILDICYSAATALKSINQHKPDILFLDIEMPFMNGFELLEKLGEIHFEIIFTTSYDQYAIKAIHFSALDYLLKPIDREELQKAVLKAMKRNQHMLPQQLDILLQKLKHPAVQINKIPIPTMEGFQLVPFDTIISCQSESNYTYLFLKNKSKIIASRTLKEVEEILEDFPFIRVHHSHVVNINEVEKYVKGEGGYLVMTDGSTISVSRSRKELLLKVFTGKS
ncbi:MAG TPA: LytTR family DNA-binding domain-containing protein [Agriterribacter sp.]|nr:LytTR family DNA-binding domain-containing protein [Agriterribacter sp.]